VKGQETSIIQEKMKVAHQTRSSNLEALSVDEKKQAKNVRGRRAPGSGDNFSIQISGTNYDHNQRMKKKKVCQRWEKGISNVMGKGNKNGKRL